MERTVTVRLHGPLREAAGKTALRVGLPPKATAASLKRALAELLEGGAGLLDGSMIADSERILSKDSPLRGRTFDVLPPVAGG